MKLLILQHRQGDPYSDNTLQYGNVGRLANGDRSFDTILYIFQGSLQAYSSLHIFAFVGKEEHLTFAEVSIYKRFGRTAIAASKNTGASASDEKNNLQPFIEAVRTLSIINFAPMDR